MKKKKKELEQEAIDHEDMKYMVLDALDDVKRNLGNVGEKLKDLSVALEALQQKVLNIEKCVEEE